MPVRDLDEAREFYVEALGCQATRARDGFVDIWFFGMQVTLHDRPDEVRPPNAVMSRHFGVTLDRHEFDGLVARLEEHGVPWLAPVTTDFPGTPVEQTKTKFADPSGNVLELKTYVDVAAALEISTHSYPEAIEHGN
jgi:extradiol dioxygenase family protein